MSKQIAIYGKGGIGKSTMSSNISAALAYKGNKVMQIGCDPKKDSIRLLVGNQKIVSILDYLQEHGSVKEVQEIVQEGYKGIKCIESGGPEPGVGCAGRGIILSIDTLKKLGVFEWENDYILYDVLGDVVCGGFAVPIREGYAQEIYLVVSGEFMSIYAANNISKCIKKYAEKGSVQLRGIILNSRGIPKEEYIVREFAKAINTEVVLEIPRDNTFHEAEIVKKTVIELNPESNLAKKFLDFTDIIKSECEPKIPQPLDDDGIYELYNNLV